MKTMKIIMSLAATVLSLSPAIHARDSVTASGTAVVTPGASGQLTLSHDRVSFSQPLMASSNISLLEHKYEAVSRQFSRQVSGREFSRGVQLNTTSPGAIVRISALLKEHSKLRSPLVQPEDIRVRSGEGEMTAKDYGMGLSAKTSDLNQFAPNLFKATSAFKLATQLGQGHITLRARKKLPDNSRYLINVYDKNSDLTLVAAAKHSSVATGGVISIAAHVSQGAIRKASAVLVSARGKTTPFSISRDSSGALTVSGIARRQDATTVPGALAEVHLDVTSERGGIQITRQIRVPVEIHRQTATFASRSQPKATTAGLSVPIRVTHAGRFEIRALAFGKDQLGQWRPAYLIQSAAWLKPGTGTISLPLDWKALRASGLHAPYQIQQIKLMDQGQIAVLAQRAVAWNISRHGMRPGAGDRRQ